LPRGWLSFSVVELDGEPLAFHFGFVYRGRLVWYKPSYNVSFAKYSPGLLLIRFLAEYALAEGIDELDFTIGNEAFKQRFTNAERINCDLVFFRRRIPYWSARIHREIRSAARRAIYPTLECSEIGPFAPRATL
jgi:hypothetical protein